MFGTYKAKILPMGQSGNASKAELIEESAIYSVSAKHADLLSRTEKIPWLSRTIKKIMR